MSRLAMLLGQFRFQLGQLSFFLNLIILKFEIN